MAITNVAYKVCTRNRLKDAAFGDYKTQPRMLQAVTNIADITSGNGFVAADLVPGDLLPIMSSETDKLLIWRGADDAFQEIGVSPSSLLGIAPARARDRFQLLWKAGENGRVGLNTAVEPTTTNPTLTEMSLMIASDWDFEVLGTNIAAAGATHYAEGGLALLTAGADGDEAILVPHLNTDLSPWTAVTWGNDESVHWECLIRTAASITNCIIWAGLKLTNTEVVATDANQCFFRFEDDVNSGKFQTIDEAATVNNTQDSGVTVAINTDYHLAIEIDSSRIPRYYINGDLVATGDALTTPDIDLIPYIGVAADGAAAAKTLYARAQAISRLYDTNA